MTNLQKTPRTTSTPADQDLQIIVDVALHHANQVAENVSGFTAVIAQLGELAAVGRKPSLFTIEQAAEELNVSRSTVYALISRGELPQVHIGRSARIRRIDLEQFIAALDGAAS